MNEPTSVFSTPGKRRPRESTITCLDSFKKDAIRSHVYEYYKRKELSTLQKLKESLKERGLFSGEKSSLSIVLKNLGFKWKKQSGRKVLLERTDIAAWRSRFLREIVNHRPEDIIWLDETWVNAGHTRSESWTDDSVDGTMKTPIGKGGRLILLHAGSCDGFVPNAMLLFTSKKSSDYHEEMTGDRFEEWFIKSLLPNIRPNSIIVMDNAPYHSMQMNRAPTMSNKKNEILEWLRKNDIPGVEEAMTKVELIEIVKFYKPRFVQYKIDTIAEEKGFKILRIPPYHCHFNAIELIWAQIKGYVANNNKTFTLTSVGNLVKEAIENMSADQWKSVVYHTWDELQKAWREEGILQERVSELIITLGDSDEDDSVSEQSEEDITGSAELEAYFEDCGVSPLE